MSAELATIDGEIIEHRAPLTLFGTDDPAAVVERATKVATVLADVIKQRNLSKRIGNRDHIQIEGWTLLGSMLGVFGEVEWTRSLDHGWEARAVARTMAGTTVGAAEAMCSRSERTWAQRDEYAIRSMAQTRALSKALRLPLGFIVELAGFAATPAEEMDGIEQSQGGERGSRSGTTAPTHATTRSSAAPKSKGEALGLIADAAKAHGLSFAGIEAKAKELRIDRGSASIEDLMRLLGAIEHPEQEAVGPLLAPAPEPTSVPSVADQDAPASDEAVVAHAPASIQSTEGGVGPAPVEPEPVTSPPGDAAPANQSVPAGEGSPPSSQPAPFTDPASLETYAAMVLDFDTPQPLKDLTPAEWAEVWTSLGIAEADAYEAWHKGQSRDVRAALMASHQSPRHRRDAAKAMASERPTAEQIRAALGEEQ